MPHWLGHAFTIFVCGAALWKGDWEERLAAVVVALSIAISIAMRDLSWPRIQLTGLLVDVAELAVLLFIALRSRKYWPMAAAAFQFLAVMTHIAKMMDPLLHQWAYITAIIIWTYLIFIALGVGTFNAWRARRQLAKADAPARATRR